MKQLEKSSLSEIARIKKEVISKIKPSIEEERRIREASKEILAKVEEHAKKIDSRIEASIFGSVSRNTWLKGENDIDIFLKFPLEYDKKSMEKIVFEIANKLFERVEKKFAEHPYARAGFNGYEIELVPCYSIKSVSEMKSAVDRTPFHDSFIKQNLKGKEDEVRVLKQFLKALGIYGAEEKIRGFSGYLCELLIIKYGSFENLLRHAAKWERGEVLKIGKAEISEEDARRIFFENPALIFIDPVDSKRNVAAALSEDNFYYFKFACMQFLSLPKLSFFFPEKRKTSESEIRKIIKERGIKYIAIAFARPGVVEEILYSQLRKAEKIIKNYLEINDFKVLRAEHFACDESCYIILELYFSELPRYFLKAGPYIKMRKNAENFMRKHEKAFLIKDRLFAYAERKFKSTKELLNSMLKNKSKKELESLGMPKYVAESIEKELKILENEEILEHVKTEEALEEIADFIDPKFPWISENE